ncbi:ComF family protein [Thalassospira sp.]|uniref:ComF family protein n=1 Tax=Thalassospira sp. TaxID=1912094 RepID=UPI000C36F352|nr:ComF family protein [Thalassospira sp.]MBC06686.1 amidophosphoribosyltransferase [Thalassospira sp.]|tara:strand:+ start:11354 stop:12106 length:753 start_codon:yes stop_codon:yes gene_type:complete
MIGWARTVATMGINAILPPRCGGCGDVTDTTHAVCADCWAGLRFISAPQCACCGYPFELDVFDGGDGEQMLCAACLQKKPAFDQARAALVYDDHSREYLLRFKHADRGDLTPLLARWVYQAGKGIWEQADLIVPVPLHRKRLLKRRYNQSGLLAAKLSRMTGVHWDGLVLRRARNTRSLGGLGPSSRKREVGGAFEVDEVQAVKCNLAGARVVLIDDVLTTGATANACVRALKRSGAMHVSVITVARVVR